MNTVMKRKGMAAYPSFFEDFPNRSLLDWLDDLGVGKTPENITLPRVNIMETGTDYKIEMAVPGMKKEDFKVELDNKTLVIRAEKSEEPKEEANGTYTRKEFSYSAFRRTFDLPNTVESDKIEATYMDGILKLSIPKRAEVMQKPLRTIEIS